MADNKARFLSIGLSEKEVQSIFKNPKTVSAVASVLDQAQVGESGTDKATGILLYNVATKLPSDANEVTAAHRKDFLAYIMNGQIKSMAQLDAAIKYFKSNKTFAFDKQTFEKASGVGVVVTPEEIKSTVTSFIEANKEKLVSERYRCLGPLLGQLNGILEWADKKALKEEWDRQTFELLGERTEADKQKVKAPAPVVESKVAAEEKKQEDVDDFLEARDIPFARNTEEQLKKHLAATGGKIITRFPPEPNGYLHLGHAKAMAFNFGIAKDKGGECIMRFDDTNPEAEKKVYIDNIIENMGWLGHTPSQITYSSDYFPQLYDLAIYLIKKGLAYVDHQTAAEIEECRKNKTDSPWRDRPIEENLKLFEDMKNGKFEEGKATLRMKGDMKHPNPQMWDVVAYRIKYAPHPHVGDRWCIYPTYDYTHCIIDSLENITHSLCTLEFEVRRESYFWLLWALDLYKPKVWEYSRLNVTNNVLSKRRLLVLVNEKYVNGWDDPRLFTLNGLRRRGYTPDAINAFCKTIGVSRNANMIPISVLEAAARDDLEKRGTRAMVVVDPVRVTLTNYPADKVEELEAPNHPKDESRGTHKVTLSRVLYIDRSDFRADAANDKKYYGLAPGKEVYLKYAYNIKCQDFKTDAAGNVTEILATVDLKNENKCPGKIQWVAEPAPGVTPLTVELRLYSKLFMSENPMKVENWTSDINPDSLVVKRAFADPSLASVKPGDHFQFERVGFFCCDPDSTDSLKVFNRTVELVQSKERAPAPAQPKRDNAKAPAAPKEKKERKTVRGVKDT